ncbi:MAG: hypothetical protein ACOY99_13130 [Pseudomonadota bacterium]
MVRAVIAIIAGLGGALIVILATEWLGHMLAPSMGAAPGEFESVAMAGAALPLASLVLVLLAYVLGSLAGGWITARIMGDRQWWPSLTVGAMLLLGVIMNLEAIPHPLWFAVLALVIPLPLALAGFRLARSLAR